MTQRHNLELKGQNCPNQEGTTDRSKSLTRKRSIAKNNLNLQEVGEKYITE